MRLAFVVLAALALAGPARADVITFGPQPFTAAPDQPVTLLFPQFDPSLGELLQVAWNLPLVRVEGQVASFDSELTGRFDGIVSLGASTLAFAPGIPPELGITLGGSYLATISLLPDNEPGLPPDFAGGDSVRLTNPGVEPRFFPTIPLRESFPEYVGAGTVTFTIPTIFPIAGAILPFGVLSTRIEEPGTISGAAFLSYEFTPVPEPSTLALVGLAALAGLGLQRYRRQRGTVAGND